MLATFRDLFHILNNFSVQESDDCRKTTISTRDLLANPAAKTRAELTLASQEDSFILLTLRLLSPSKVPSTVPASQSRPLRQGPDENLTL